MAPFSLVWSQRAWHHFLWFGTKGHGTILFGLGRKDHGTIFFGLEPKKIG
jgi:hypothetical protein